MTALLEATSLDLYYADAQALADVSLKISKGEIAAIVGANGRQVIADPRHRRYRTTARRPDCFCRTRYHRPGFVRDLQSRHRSSCRGAPALSYFDRDGEFAHGCHAGARSCKNETNNGERI